MNARAQSIASAPLVQPAEVWWQTALRSVLRWPGRVLDVLDGREYTPMRLAAPDPGPLWTPEAYYGLQAGLAHHQRGEDHAAFHVEGGTALLVGGVQAPAERRRSVLQSLVHATRSLGVRRHVAFPVREEELADCRQAGFAMLQVGVEAWVDLEDFTLKGKPWAHLRQMRNRARSRGVEVEETAPGPWDDAMRTVWDAWVEAKQPRWELKWLTGTPSLERPLGRRYFVAHRQGRLQAFCTLLPGPDGTWSVDVLCRIPDATAGSMERLLVHAFETLRAEGVVSVNLGPCPMAGLDEGERGLRAGLFRWAFASSWGDSLFGFKRLHAFKAKFRPRWEPVYLGAAPRLGWVELYAAARVWAL